MLAGEACMREGCEGLLGVLRWLGTAQVAAPRLLDTGVPTARHPHAAAWVWSRLDAHPALPAPAPARPQPNVGLRRRLTWRWWGRA